MDKFLAKKYYEREEIQKAILKFASNREIGFRFDGFFGKRPSVIEYLSDIKAVVKQGVFSFHMSEERWENPLLLESEKSEEERSKNRIGWDLIIDLDGADIIFSKITAKIIIDFLRELGVKNISIKYSGNKGFHIGIPFEAFSKSIIGFGETRLLFPDAARKIMLYIIHEIKGKIAKTILEEIGSVEVISRKFNIEINELINNDKSTYNLDYMKLIELDTVLISSRHLFRMPYSINEKSGLVSIPIRSDLVMDFEKFIAKPIKVDPKKYEKFEFLKYEEKYGTDADILIVKAYESFEEHEEDYELLNKSVEKMKRGEKRGIIFTGDVEFADFEIDEEVEMKDFPLTIKYILENKFEDGKKRALFVLLTFLHSINYSEEIINSMVREWNNNCPDPLKENYLVAQINWFKSHEKKISPPNFSNANYYSSIGVPSEDIEADKKKFRGKEVKNPLHYVYLFTKSKPKKKN